MRVPSVLGPGLLNNTGSLRHGIRRLVNELPETSVSSASSAVNP